MADQDTQEPKEVSEATGKASSGGLLGKLVVVAFLALVVVAETIVAFLILPSSQETHAMAEARIAETPSKSAIPDEFDDLIHEEALDLREVDLGDFSVSSYQPLTNTTLRIDLHLFATVLAEDESEFVERIDENQHRVREQVLITLRSADISDLSDAGLALIKRKILEKVNQTLGKKLIVDLILSDFSFIEQ